MKTQLSPFNLRHIFALTAIIVLSVVVLKYSDTASSHVVKLSPAVKAAAASNQKIKLQDSYQLPTEYETDRLSDAGTPLGLASADFDADGFPDLISGYTSQTGGYLVFQRGNSESFAPTLPENIENTNNSRFGATFLPTTKVIEISDAPDFIVTGDFNRDNDLDILTAKRGGTDLSLTIGNGAGGFGETRKIPMSGTITALAAGQIDSPDNLADAVIGISDDNGAALLVYQGANGFDEKPVRYNLNNPADLLVLGQMDDSPWMDVAILAGGNVSILHGRNQRETEAAETNRFEEIPLPFAVQTLALGQFIWDREGLNELALLREDGNVSFITQGELDTRPFTIAERMERRRRQNLPESDANKLVRSMKNWQTDESKAWRVTEDLHVMDASAVRANITKIFNAQLSGQAADDLVVLDTETRQIKIFAVEAPPKVDGEDISHGGERREMALPTENAPIAVLSMRTSLFVRQGLVVLREGDNAPQIAPSAPSATFTVSKTADTNDGACNADCSLREAHVAANGAGGADMIVVPVGTYTLTIAGNDDGAAQGDLDVNGDATISGAGAATTILQAGTTNANGIDKVVGFNPTCSNVSGTVNNVTVRFGNNTNPDGSPNFEHTGGGLDYCGGGASTIAITNSTFDQNTVNN
ncbi:MAG TPA: CSLREA domain-containing protein, partial [Pyrinomonadaceae bacterium]|nr:CSLREA domain-containing protein [Pyrinomonadaceae bacterium]